MTGLANLAERIVNSRTFKIVDLVTEVLFVISVAVMWLLFWAK
jgi:hypothetical protein